MSTLVVEQELYRSCRILFGSELEIGRDFLHYLRYSGLKKAYRLKARQTHPDLVAADQPSAGNNCLPDFVSVHQAYENLRVYLERRDLGFRFFSTTPPPQSGFGPASSWRSTSEQFRQQRWARSESPGAGAAQHGGDSPFTRLYHGPVPPIRLRLGNFLYYSGLIDWMTVARALIWQRSQRPRLGELARRLGWLTEEEVWQVLTSRQLQEKFGDSAVRRQKLTAKQLSSLIIYQKFLQKKLGEFFLEQQLFTRAELDELVRRQREHNATCPRPGSA